MSNGIFWTPGMSLDYLEKHVILQAYRFYQHKTTTANSLGISVRTLDERLKRYAQEDEEDKKRKEDFKQRQLDFQRRERGMVVDHDTMDEKVKLTTNVDTLGNKVETTSKVDTPRTISNKQVKK